MVTSGLSFTMEPQIFSHREYCYVFNPHIKQSLCRFLMRITRIPENLTALLAGVFAIGVIEYSLTVFLWGLVVGALIPWCARWIIFEWLRYGIRLKQREKGPLGGLKSGTRSVCYPREFYLIVEKARQLCADGEMSTYQVEKLHLILWKYSFSRELFPLSEHLRQIFYDILNDEYADDDTPTKPIAIPAFNRNKNTGENR